MKTIQKLFTALLSGMIIISSITPVMAQRSEKGEGTRNDLKNKELKQSSRESAANRSNVSTRVTANRGINENNKTKDRVVVNQKTKESLQGNSNKRPAISSIGQTTGRTERPSAIGQGAVGNRGERPTASSRGDQWASNNSRPAGNKGESAGIVNNRFENVNNKRGEISLSDFNKSIANGHSNRGESQFNRPNDFMKQVHTKRINNHDVHVYNNRYNYYHTVNRLPKHAYRHYYGGIPYYCVGNKYYRPHGHGYVICRPPVGAYFAAALFTHAFVTITVNAINAASQRYYYDDGTFYQQRNSNYYVVEPPVGAIVPALPYGYEELVLNGRSYYKVDGTYYTPVGSGFRVVGKTVAYA